jgi:hypothetical protein
MGRFLNGHLLDEVYLEGGELREGEVCKVVLRDVSSDAGEELHEPDGGTVVLLLLEMEDDDGQFVCGEFAFIYAE